MFLRAIRAAEPALKELSRRVFSPWKGNHVACGDLSSTIIPWGFVSQQKVSESVRPDRAGDGPGDDGRVEKRAEHLNLDTWEFLRVRHFLSISGCWLFPPSFPGFGKNLRKSTPTSSIYCFRVFNSRASFLGSRACLPMRCRTLRAPTAQAEGPTAI
ncbi:unnamed protein product, partial [Ectocarpus sp. 12 AP-2014]